MISASSRQRLAASFWWRLALRSVVTALGFGCAGSSDVDWPAYWGDPGSGQYSALAQITVDNVGQLELAWVYGSGDADPKDRSQIQCNPIIIDGVLYGTSPKMKLFALDAAMGESGGASILSTTTTVSGASA